MSKYPKGFGWWENNDENPNYGLAGGWLQRSAGMGKSEADRKTRMELDVELDVAAMLHDAEYHASWGV